MPRNGKSEEDGAGGMDERRGKGGEKAAATLSLAILMNALDDDMQLRLPYNFTAHNLSQPNKPL